MWDRDDFRTRRTSRLFGFEEPLTPAEQRKRDARRDKMQAPLTDGPLKKT